MHSGDSVRIWPTPLFALTLPVMMGVFFMVFSGAPQPFIAVNLAALSVSALALIFLRLPTAAKSQLILLLFCLALLAATLAVGIRLDGIARWISVGPIRLHAALLLLPVICVLAVRAAPPITALAYTICSVIVAFQPDRASALALFLSSLAIAFLRRSLSSMSSAIIAGTALAITLYLPDPLQGSEYVEDVIASGFASHPVLGIALFAAMSAAIAIPLFKGRNSLPLMAAMLGFFLASLLGPYPTPLIGYGASPIMGYALGLLLIFQPSGYQTGSTSGPLTS